MSFFNVKIEGLDSLDKDFEEHKRAIYQKVPKALHFVGSEMIGDLQRHIMDDFYDAYTPEGYHRRFDYYPNLGTPMISQDNMDVNVRGQELSFVYSPKTEHSNLDSWVQDKPVKGIFSLSSRTGDDLIVWGQMSHFDGRIPARPFWNRFVEEQSRSNLLDNFIIGMGTVYKVEKESAEKVEMDGNEMLPAESM